MMRLFFLVFFSFFSINIFAQNIFSFLEYFEKANYQKNIKFDYQDSFSALEKDIYFFFQTKAYFYQKQFLKASAMLKKSSTTSASFVQKSLANFVVANLNNYSIEELILLVELFPEFLNNISLLDAIKDKLPSQQNKKIYKKLWLFGKIKSTQISHDKDFYNSNKEYLQHLRNLYKNREYIYLLQQYPRIKKRFQKDSSNYNQYLYQYAIVLRKKKKYEKALLVLKKAKPETKVLLLQLKLHLILNQEKNAHQLIETVKLTNSHKIINTLRLEFARHHYLNQEYQDAFFRFQKINWKYLSTHQKEQGVWRQFYSSVHNANYKNLYQKFKDQNFQFQKYQAAICYWYQKFQSDKKARHSCFTEYFLNYYGWRAVHNKEVDFTKLVPVYRQKLNFLQDKNILLLQKIYQLQEEEFTDFLVSKYMAANKTQENFQKSAYLFSQNQRYVKLIALANQYYNFQQLQKSPFLEAWLKALFPLGYSKQVFILAKTNKIEPALVFALIREESHFNPKAVSSAGALGLMQIMPFTAKDVALRKKISLQGKNLKDINLNLTLGLSYLAWELKRFQGNKSYALAAYNGGGSNVRKWQKNQQKDFDYWLEAIPFLETKNYVKKVIRSYYIYKHLYKEEWEK